MFALFSQSPPALLSALAVLALSTLTLVILLLRSQGRVRAAQANNNELQQKVQSAEVRSTELALQVVNEREKVDQLQQKVTLLHGRYESLKATLEQKETHFQQQLSLLQDSKESLKKEFALLANQVFEDKSQQFKHLNQENMEQLLKPVQGELKGFRDKMEHIHAQELQQRAALKTELQHLQKLNQSITEQAQQLSTALQGQKKTQGNWGELMLENVLDSAGLRLNQDYRREVSFDSPVGRLRPDVVVYLPQQRHIVIDAKTSLNAYTRYVNAQTELEAQQALGEHVQAVNDRINELAGKDYHRLEQLNSPEVVIMFMPIESAFVEALKFQPDLYQRAIEKNILVATPTTLLTSLNIVKQLWRFEDQSKHTQELAKRAERFYNKLNAFLVSMEGVGKQLDKARETYDKAFSQLYSGKGNLIKQANEFKELGVAVQKELPESLRDKAELELKHCD
ncbi:MULTISPECIES: DNA recombination protein RmuC [unclassified Pseudoalteromonas]|uniref:DNA recombination protein RmuC n=1 Tax=unclassified Pseudoalteromonas TaxID=194690 RepID=UPI000CF68318|nr:MULTISPECIES: DNA recombination protein RmuC [unclassified Pseudoalteromonas]MBS3797568.1 DNA recombination protein RmuC [Pseudoalteromonas sp. BDTF-M6]